MIGREARLAVRLEAGTMERDLRNLCTPGSRGRARLVACLLLSLPLAAPCLAQSVAPQLFSDLKWRMIGPFRGGRAVAVGGVPGVGSTFFFGAVDGGVWKTTDAGVVWRPVFDNQPVASIGALEVSAANPQVIYVGTGESDIRSNLASGGGVYKSIDGGETWRYAGLGETRQISKIVIDPTNPDVVYVGALGHAYGPNAERGVYKSTDGGATWKTYPRPRCADRSGGPRDRGRQAERAVRISVGSASTALEYLCAARGSRQRDLPLDRWR